MATEIPLIMQRALALMKHHVEVEPTTSEYTLTVRVKSYPLEGPDEFTQHVLSYQYRNFELLVIARWAATTNVFRVKHNMWASSDSDNPDTIIGVGGMFVKAGNLMRQLKALQ